MTFDTATPFAETAGEAAQDSTFRPSGLSSCAPTSHISSYDSCYEIANTERFAVPSRPNYSEFSEEVSGFDAIADFAIANAEAAYLTSLLPQATDFNIAIRQQKFDEFELTKDEVDYLASLLAQIPEGKPKSVKTTSGILHIGWFACRYSDVSVATIVGFKPLKTFCLSQKYGDWSYGPCTNYLLTEKVFSKISSAA